MQRKSIAVHVFSDAPAVLFLKQFPGGTGELDGFKFSFGLEIPEFIDVLIVFNRASYSLATTLSVERTVFIAAEPDVIHPYSTSYLNQFGIALSVSNKKLKTEKWQTAPCWYWFAGVDFSKPWTLEYFKGYDYFSDLPVPEKSDKISIVTSNKVFTEYHRKRTAFIEVLADRIPQHLEIYGRGRRSVDDKAEALLPHKYHLALENSTGNDTWTEKLADPYLCWAFPFYAGCTNVEDYLPDNSFMYVDLANPDNAVDQIVIAIQNDKWGKSKPELECARQQILTEHNLASLFVRLARAAMAKSVTTTTGKTRYIWSERSLWPEKGSRGNALEWTTRNALMLFDKGIELKTVGIRKRLETSRAAKRQRRLAKAERSKQ